MADQMFNCPCCRFPTLGELGAYEICSICWWEDDGQDDLTADDVWGGPNGEYSLALARTNFLDHGHMYTRGEGIVPVENPSRARLALLDYVAAVSSGERDLQVAALNSLIVDVRRRT